MNRLAAESSPYLRQHANNPVDWYPWGDEAFTRARVEQKPILLSVGYSSCHWCHVMAHESFENPEIAALMNEGFINVKVDREERPDVDAVYMTVTQALTGQGGWPMTVFLTPDLQPFFAGTYFPPDDRYGRPGFPALLRNVMDGWTEDRAHLVESAASITQQLREAMTRAQRGGGAIPGADALDRVVEALHGMFDAEHGGFGRAPKFPSPSNLEFLLAYHHRRAGQEPRALMMVTHTLDAMISGGMYDQLGGGFARYSVDAQWLVPHFEKMLYDNAQLARLYLHGYQVTGDQRYAQIVRETLDYLDREMRDSHGGFHAAQDADSEGIEGKFFVWTPFEIGIALGPEDARIACVVYDVTPEGNFEDPHHPELGPASVLSRTRSLEMCAAELDTTVDDLRTRLPGIRQRLLAAREQRIRPGLDDKVLTSWNGLAIAAFAEAGRVLDEPRYVATAERVARFLRERMWDDGMLFHTYKDGAARVDGLLDDYAYVGLGLIELHRATGDLDHLAWAERLFDAAMDRFHDEEAGGFFEAPLDGEELLLQQKPFFDSPTPSGNGAMALLALWLARTTGRAEWETVAAEVLALVAEAIERAATGVGTSLLALNLLTTPPREIAIVGAATVREPFEREVARRFLPTTVIVPADPGGGLPLLEGRDPADGAAAAYVCEAMVCGLPALSVETLREQLGG